MGDRCEMDNGLCKRDAADDLVAAAAQRRHEDAADEAALTRDVDPHRTRNSSNLAGYFDRILR
jgi:hypothetical protein